MYEQVVNRYGRLDVIYNNMGLMDRGDGSGAAALPPDVGITAAFTVPE